MPNLYGIHDEEGAHLVPPDGWCVALVSLSEDANPKDYTAIRSDINWIVRVNWGYGTQGTIPLPGNMPDYLARLSHFVAGSRGVHTYQIGNEPNHENERPQGVYISPQMYAEVFIKAHNLVKKMHLGNRVAPAAPAPYHANPTDWTLYTKEMLLRIAEAAMPDSLTCHAYSRGSSPASVEDATRMQPPLQHTYNGFLTYLDFLDCVPSVMRHLPVDITECDENLESAWVNAPTGIVPAFYLEVHEHNQRPGVQKIRSLSLYRYPNHDKWGFKDKGGVIEDFKKAVTMGLQSPQMGPEGTKGTILMPSIKNDTKNQPEPSTPFERKIDPRALDRGVSFTEIAGTPGQTVWKVKEIRWLDVNESRGLHHIFFETLDEQGKRITGVKLQVVWPTGSTEVVSEVKPGEPYSANYPMSGSRNDYSVQVVGNGASEMVRGIGMGADLGDGFNKNHHTSTVVVWQRVKAAEQGQNTPKTPPVMSLVHPVRPPLYRKITQHFGENTEDYERFLIDGVPLRGHNGTDFATPMGTDIVAVDSGRVTEKAYDAEGYGNYIKVVHPWGETVYAHLDKTFTDVGMIVLKGQLIGASGNSGNSTGPHFHFGLRVNPFNRKDGMGGFSDPEKYLPRTSSPQQPLPKVDIPAIQAIRTAAQETSLEWQLLASLAWAESSFRGDVKDGLFQIGDMAWEDYARHVGATDRNNNLDNARVGAMYLKWLLVQTHGDLDSALIAWNFGIGNVLDGEKPPAITLEFVNKVKHGRDLLKAVGA